MGGGTLVLALYVYFGHLYSTLEGCGDSLGYVRVPTASANGALVAVKHVCGGVDRTEVGEAFTGCTGEYHVAFVVNQGHLVVCGDVCIKHASAVYVAEFNAYSVFALLQKGKGDLGDVIIGVVLVKIAISRPDHLTV